mgnify:FL=1
MRFNAKEKKEILDNEKDYPVLAALIKRQNAWDFKEATR